MLKCSVAGKSDWNADRDDMQPFKLPKYLDGAVSVSCRASAVVFHENEHKTKHITFKCQ